MEAETCGDIVIEGQVFGQVASAMVPIFTGGTLGVIFSPPIPTSRSWRWGYQKEDEELDGTLDITEKKPG